MRATLDCYSTMRAGMIARLADSRVRILWCRVRGIRGRGIGIHTSLIHQLAILTPQGILAPLLMEMEIMEILAKAGRGLGIIMQLRWCLEQFTQVTIRRHFHQSFQFNLRAHQHQSFQLLHLRK